MTRTTKKVVLYGRVSTDHHHQDPEVQLAELRQYAQAREWAVIEEIADHGYSGGTDDRPGLKRLMTLCRSRKVDVIAVAKLDRLFRSLKHLVNVLDEFRALGVEFVSVHDALDFSTPSGRLLVGILGCLGEFEKDLVRERTLLGLAHARRKGKRLGRPHHGHDTEIINLRNQGMSFRQIAATIGVSRAAVYRTLKSVAQNPPQNLASCTKENISVFESK